MTTVEVIQQSLGSVVLEETGQSIEIIQPVVDIVEVAAPGPQGPAGTSGPPGPTGPPGSGAETTYVHEQGAPSAQWLIVHNLGRYPAVTTVDSAGAEQDGEVIYGSADQLTVVFVLPFGGRAYLN